ncbi:hypothetical protein ASPVEDRAFT_270708 [Aspergillus versicolor CBS 583.65]|uniref:Uncharacterized protein n=1 Tax=Aspergillus versicolor CBS 583.65 TaxID=1036611 RepID=A0A1L9P6H1_ASPVE|nr:uncharacterized protein ASPVEDRAFT_270708 [Aspergillus versicolor CBS 583.65]OJI97092.1 hypothetical protein ASPVEDRAFT_270708 [Aspergillus versicolor CBS 583.65]
MILSHCLHSEEIRSPTLLLRNIRLIGLLFSPQRSRLPVLLRLLCKLYVASCFQPISGGICSQVRTPRSGQFIVKAQRVYPTDPTRYEVNEMTYRRRGCLVRPLSSAQPLLAPPLFRLRFLSPASGLFLFNVFYPLCFIYLFYFIFFPCSPSVVPHYLLGGFLHGQSGFRDSSISRSLSPPSLSENVGPKKSK